MTFVLLGAGCLVGAVIGWAIPKLMFGPELRRLRKERDRLRKVLGRMEQP